MAWDQKNLSSNMSGRSSIYMLGDHKQVIIPLQAYFLICQMGVDDIFLNRGLLAQNLYWGENRYLYIYG